MVKPSRLEARETATTSSHGDHEDLLPSCTHSLPTRLRPDQDNRTLATSLSTWPHWARRNPGHHVTTESGAWSLPWSGPHCPPRPMQDDRVELAARNLTEPTLLPSMDWPSSATSPPSMTELSPPRPDRLTAAFHDGETGTGRGKAGWGFFFF